MTREYDRFATIPVRQRGSDYPVQVGLDEGREEFQLISVTNPTNLGKVEKEFHIYGHLLGPRVMAHTRPVLPLPDQAPERHRSVACHTALLEHAAIH